MLSRETSERGITGKKYKGGRGDKLERERGSKTRRRGEINYKEREGERRGRLARERGEK
jgi:hypothetical protein